MTEPLLSAARLHDLLGDPSLVVVDCRFSLADASAGLRAYEHGHLPGAVYAHLERDLSGEVVRGRTGRHPLPEPGALATRLGGWGISRDSRVVVYDDAGGAMAARLWFLLRWLGHDAVAVLDGGLPAWTAAGYPLTTDLPRPEARTFVPALR
ncbi:MAG: sulfurtransferase, partial [Deltaproteobacteria bacterium]|nr:sulfurtransferase [Deltaproteobacteria bacterium]